MDEPRELIPCERCGRSISSNGIVQHIQSCKRLPTPEELWKEYHDIKGMRVDNMARRYKASVETIRTRMRLHGEVVDKSRDLCERCNLPIQASNYARHLKKCLTIPLPEELWEMYKRGENAYKMSQRFKCGSASIINRIKTVADEEEYAMYSNHYQTRYPKRATKPLHRHRCGCGVMLFNSEEEVPVKIKKHDRIMLVDDGSGKCVWCRKLEQEKQHA